jgi:hypothetical protein
MKKITLLFSFLCVMMFAQGAVSKTVNLTAGTLATVLTPIELGTVTNLTITGTMDARDFQCIRDFMPSISDLNISGATIVAYTGTSGTSFLTINYSANEIPDFAFCRLFPSLFVCPVKSVSLPTSITAIGFIAFGSTALTTIAIPASVTTIKDGAFAKCTLLSSVSLPSSLKTLEKTAFGYCQSLTSISLPSTLTTLADSVFKGCSSLTSLTIPNGVSVIGNSLCRGCTSLNAVTLPNAVSSIGKSAFLGCKIASVSLPSTVTSIADSAFYNCTSLASIVVSKATPVDLSSSPAVFTGVNKSTCVLAVPNKTVYASSIVWKDFTNMIATTVNDLNVLDFNVYPSPTKGDFKIELISSVGEVLSVSIVDGFGRVVFSDQLTKSQSSFDLTSLGLKGVNILVLKDKNGSIVGQRKMIFE